MVMQVANTRESLILALKNDKNSERWEEFVNQYYGFLYFAACKVDKESGRHAFIPEGVDPGEAVEQTFWQLKNIILPDRPQYDVDFTEDELAKIGVNIVIYANQLLRAAYPAMKACAERILSCQRAQEASAEFCMPIKEILALI